MVSLADSLVSSSARKLPIRVRSDLQFKRSLYLGRSFWVVKDPVGLKYFRFQEEEFWILKQFDGTKSLDEIKEGFESEFPPQKITLEDLQSFIGTLHQSGLIVAGVPDQGHELLKRRNKRRRQEILGQMSNVLCIKFKGLDLDTALGKMEPYVRFLYHPTVVYSCLCLCLCALTLVLVEFDYFRSKLPGFQNFFSPANLFVLSVTLGLTKVLHEFGHGLTCKHFGGECHEMGVMILVLTPCLYCNVSDSWMLPSKWHRIAIGVAGVYIECCLAAVCTFIWWFTTPGLLNHLCLNVMFISSVSTVVFNINPLLRYDGYYILSDLLEIPNLRQKATTIMTRKCSQWFLGMEQQPDPFLPQKNQILFALFTVASFGYRWIVMASILYFVYKLTDAYGLKVLGQGIAMMSLWGLIGMPVYKVVKFFWVPGRIYRVKKLNFYLSLGALGALVAAFCFIKLPYTVVIPAILELRSTDSQIVYIPEFGGRLVEVNVRPGDHVRQGDVLARIENARLLLEISELLSKQTTLKIHYENLLALRSQTNQSAGQFSLEVQPTLEEFYSVNDELERKSRDFRRLTITAPRDGYVVSPPWKPEKEPTKGQLPSWWGSPLERRNLGVTFDAAAIGTELCSIGDLKKLEAVLVVDQSKIDFVKPDQDVELKFDEFPHEIFRSQIGEFKDIESMEMETIPVALSTKGRGDVPTTTEEGLEKPASTSHRVLVPIDNDHERFLVGMTGSAKVHVEPQTLLQRLWRLINETLSFRL